MEPMYAPALCEARRRALASSVPAFRLRARAANVGKEPAPIAENDRNNNPYPEKLAFCDPLVCCETIVARAKHPVVK